MLIPIRQWFAAIFASLLMIFGPQIQAADLAEIQSKGEIRHLGIRYANFVTPRGDGFEVELIQGFANHLGVKYKLVLTDFYSVIRDLLGKNVVRNESGVSLVGDFPVRGDIIATGFTVLPWRQEVLLYSEPTFPSQVLLIAPVASKLKAVKETGNLDADIVQTKALIGKNRLLVMEGTCLDPGNYGLKGVGLDLKAYTKNTNLSEMVPALLNQEADLTLLDVPDAIHDLKKWNGAIKVLGPISANQDLAAAFPKNAPHLRAAFNKYLAKIRADGTYDKLVDKYFPGIRAYFPAFFAQ